MSIFNGDLDHFLRSDHLCITVRVQPRASANRIVGLFDGALKVQLTSPPVEDRANRQLVKFLSKTLGIPSAHVEIVSGEKSRTKTVAFKGISIEQLRSALTSLQGA